MDQGLGIRVRVWGYWYGQDQLHRLCVPTPARVRHFPAAQQQQASKINGRVAGFFQILTGTLAAAEKRGGVPGTVLRSDALALASRAAAAAGVPLPTAQAQRAADAASHGGPSGARIRREPFVAALQVAVRAAEEGALAEAPPLPVGLERLGGNSYHRPPSRGLPNFPEKLSIPALEALVQEKIAGKAPGGWTEARYATRLLDPCGSGVVTRGHFRDALNTLGLTVVSEEDVSALFARAADATAAAATAGDAYPLQAFVRRLLPRAFTATARPDSFHDKLRDHIKTDASRLRRSFKSADRDLRGTLSVGEIRAVLAACDVAVDDDTLDRMMRRCDLDGNGGESEIDYAQLAELISSPELTRAHAKNTAQGYLLKENRRLHTPTPAVTHFVMEEWAVRPEMRGDSRPGGAEAESLDYQRSLEVRA